MIIVRIVIEKDKERVLLIKRDSEENYNMIRKQYLKKDGTFSDGFREVETLPKSRHNLWIMSDGEIIADDIGNLEKDKEIKKTEIRIAKKIYQNRLVPIDIDGTTYHFFGGEENLQNYKGAFDGAMLQGYSSGEIAVKEKMICIDELNMKKAMGLLFRQIYKGWRKEKYYNEAIENAQTESDLDSIVWEDVYSG